MPSALDLDHTPDARLARRLSLIAGYRGPWTPSPVLGVKARPLPPPAPVVAPRIYRPSMADLSATKTCSTCEVTLPIAHFYRIHASSAARQARCKACNNAARAQSYRAPS